MLFLKRFPNEVSLKRKPIFLKKKKRKEKKRKEKKRKCLVS